MKLVREKINLSEYPADFWPILSKADVFDSSCSPEAKVIFIDFDEGYFLGSVGSKYLEVFLKRFFAISRRRRRRVPKGTQEGDDTSASISIVD